MSRPRSESGPVLNWSSPDQNWDLGRPKSKLGSGLDQFRIGPDSDLGLDIYIKNLGLNFNPVLPECMIHGVNPLVNGPSWILDNVSLSSYIHKNILVQLLLIKIRLNVIYYLIMLHHRKPFIVYRVLALNFKVFPQNY